MVACKYPDNWELYVFLCWKEQVLGYSSRCSCSLFSQFIFSGIGCFLDLQAQAVSIRLFRNLPGCHVKNIWLGSIFKPDIRRSSIPAHPDVGWSLFRSKIMIVGSRSRFPLRQINFHDPPLSYSWFHFPRKPPISAFTEVTLANHLVRDFCKSLSPCRIVIPNP